MKKPEPILVFVWNLRKAYHSQAVSFVTPMFEGLEQLLVDLYSFGFICGFRPFTKNGYDFVEIFLRYDSSGGVLCFVTKTVWKPSRDVMARLPALKAEQMIEPFSIGIIRTAKLGITTTKRAVNEKIGGSYLAKIK